MANNDNPHGFTPAVVMGGGEPYVRIYNKAATDATRLGIGDPVDISGALDTITRAAAAATIVGINMGYAPRYTLSTHPVIIPLGKVLFDVQEDGDGGAMGTASEGLTADYVAGDCNATTGRSIFEIDSSTKDTTSTHDLHLCQVAPYIDNDGTLTNARWFVLMNNERDYNQIAGV
jgi:hypothetical protein